MTPQRRRAMPWAPARLASTLPFACTALVAAATLSACGGGGSNSAPDAEVTPTAVVSTSAYLHMQRNRVDADGNFVAQDIVLVDPVTAAAVWQQSVEITSTQAAVHAFTVSADGLTITEGAEQALYYSQGGKLFELSLRTGASTPTPRQVSSEAGTCSVVRAVPTDTTASLAWVLVNTAGKDGLCDTTEDNVLKLVRSDAGSTTAALSWRGGALDAIDVHRNASGTLTQLIAFDPAVGQLLAISATDGSVSTVGGVALGTGTSVSYLGRAAGRRDQIYVVTSKLVRNTTTTQDEDQTLLRTLTWSSDTAAPTLGNVASASGLLQQATTTLSSATLNFAHTDDATGFYFVDGLKVNVIDKGKATMRTLATLSAPPELLDEKGNPTRPIVLPGGALGSSALALPVVTAEGVQMVAVAKATGSMRNFDLPPSATAVAVEARQGDQLVISQLLGDVGGPVALWRASLGAGTGAIATTAVSARAHVLGAMRDTAESLSGEAANPALVWCEAATTCTAAGLKSLQLTSGNNLALAGAGAAGFEWTAPVVGDTSGKLLPITVGTQQLNGLWASDTLWLLDATVAGSLKQVTLLTPAPQ